MQKHTILKLCSIPKASVKDILTKSLVASRSILLRENLIKGYFLGLTIFNVTLS